MNTVCLIGRITRDIEVSTTSSGKNYTRFSIAVNRQFKDANGERQADFINCVAWGSQADYLKNYASKGFQISIIGRIQVSQYNDLKNNQTRYNTDIVVEQVSILEKREQQQPQSNPYQFEKQNKSVAQQEQDFFNSPSEFDVDIDDLPF